MPGPILCARPGGRDPLSRSYGVNLPSSLTVNLSSALVCSTRPPVSVWGTGLQVICLADFLGSLLTSAVGSPGGSPYCPVSARGVDLPAPRLPTRFNALFRQRAGVSLLRLHVTHRKSNGMLTVSSIGYALRLRLRSRLTLIRLALIRNPWSCGEGVSRPLCRYLYLHLLFRYLQLRSRSTFGGCRNAPLPIRP